MRHRPLQGVPVFNFPATSPLADTHLAPSACDDDRRPSSEGVVSQALDTYKTHGLSIERDLGLSVEHKSLAPTASSMREDLDKLHGWARANQTRPPGMQGRGVGSNAWRELFQTLNRARPYAENAPELAPREMVQQLAQSFRDLSKTERGYDLLAAAIQDLEVQLHSVEDNDPRKRRLDRLKHALEQLSGSLESAGPHATSGSASDLANVVQRFRDRMAENCGRVETLLNCASTLLDIHKQEVGGQAGGMMCLLRRMETELDATKALAMRKGNDQALAEADRLAAQFDSVRVERLLVPDAQDEFISKLHRIRKDVDEPTPAPLKDTSSSVGVMARGTNAPASGTAAEGDMIATKWDEMSSSDNESSGEDVLRERAARRL